MEVNYGGILIGIILTAIAYMTYPLIRLAINKGKFERKKGHRIALWNSIIVGIVFSIVTFLLGAGAWSAAPAFLYYWINKSIISYKYR